MATQGTVAITNGLSVVEFKVVAGSDGYNAKSLAEAVLREEFVGLTCERLFDLSRQVGFGGKESLVVMGRGGDLAGDFEEDELGPLYRLTFNNPWFNPRWGNGTADHSLCIDPSKGAIYEFVDPSHAPVTSPVGNNELIDDITNMIDIGIRKQKYETDDEWQEAVREILS